MIATVPIKPAKKVTKKVLDRTSYRILNLREKVEVFDIDPSSLKNRDPTRALGNTKTVRAANIQALVEKTEKEGSKEYSNCMKKCLDESSKLTKQDLAEGGPYRINLTSSDDRSGTADFEDKMSCMLKCYYDHKMEEDDKEYLDKRTAE